MRVHQILGACLIASFTMLIVRAEDGPEKQASDNLIDSASLVKVREFKISFQKRMLAIAHDPKESVCLRLSNNGTHGAVAMVTQPAGFVLARPEMALVMFNVAQGKSITVPLTPEFPQEVLRSEPGDNTICRRLQIAWSPDGSTLAVVECARGYLWLVNQDGSVDAEMDLEKTRQDRGDIRKSVLSNLAWYPDGRTLLVIGFNGLYTVDTSRRPLVKEECILSLNDVRRFAAPSNLNPLMLSWLPDERIAAADKLPVYFWVAVAELPGTGGAMGDEFQFDFMPKERRCVGKPKSSIRPPQFSRTRVSAKEGYIAYPFSEAWIDKSAIGRLIREKVRPCPELGVAVADPNCKRVLAAIPGGIATHWSDTGERLAVFGISSEGFFVHCYESRVEAEKTVKVKDPKSEVTSEEQENVWILTAEQKKAIETALKDFEHEEFAVREAASKKILDAGLGAIVILEASLQAHDNDPERTIRMKRLLEQFKTAKFLGPDADWPKCSIQISSMDPVYGSGVDIDLQGDGACLIRIVVGRALVKGQDKKTNLQIAQEEARTFRTLCIQNSLIGTEIPIRTGGTYSVWQQITIKNAAGQTFEMRKLSSDKVPAFDQVYEALLALKDKAALEKKQK